MSLWDNIKKGMTNSLGSGIVGLGLGTVKGMLQGDMQNNYTKKIAEKQQEIAKQNALDKWSIEKASMQKAGVNISAMNGMQPTAVQQNMPTQGINNEAQIPSIAEGAQQMSQADVNKTEEQKNEEFLKQAGDYWAAQRAVYLADANLKGAQRLFQNLETIKGDYEFGIRKAVVDAFGGQSEYGRALMNQWRDAWDNLGADTLLKMSEVGLNKDNAQLAVQKTQESKEYIKCMWYQAHTVRMYNDGMLQLGFDNLEWNKQQFKMQLNWEKDKFGRQLKLDYLHYNLEKGIKEVQMQYTRELIKSEQQMRYWKPVTVLSGAFRDVTMGLGAMKNAYGSKESFKDKLGGIFNAAMVARMITKVPL